MCSLYLEYQNIRDMIYFYQSKLVATERYKIAYYILYLHSISDL